VGSVSQCRPVHTLDRFPKTSAYRFPNETPNDKDPDAPSPAMTCLSFRLHLSVHWTYMHVSYIKS